MNTLALARTKLPSVWKTAPALFYSTGSFTRTKLPPPIIAGPVGRALSGSPEEGSSLAFAVVQDGQEGQAWLQAGCNKEGAPVGA